MYKISIKHFVSFKGLLRCVERWDHDLWKDFCWCWYYNIVNRGKNKYNRSLDLLTLIYIQSIVSQQNTTITLNNYNQTWIFVCYDSRMFVKIDYYFFSYWQLYLHLWFAVRLETKITLCRSEECGLFGQKSQQMPGYRQKPVY